MSKKIVGVIGGSGLYNIEGLTDVKQLTVETPFGDPSDEYTTGTLGDTKLPGQHIWHEKARL
jgi:5'-methylthioadenosine phosphorylase